MTSEQRHDAARAFWLDEEAARDHAPAILLISERKRFRPKTIVALDRDRKAHHLASLASLPDSLAARALLAYHMAEQRPMMGAFLDALGITHEDGLISQDHTPPDAPGVASAAASLASRFPPAQVSLYLNTLLSQDPERWAALAGLPELVPGR
jgi:hypothetical protein